MTKEEIAQIIRDHVAEHPDLHDSAHQCGALEAADDILSRLSAPPAGGEVERAAQALVDRMEAVYGDDQYISVWAVNQMHTGPYDGPKWEAEFNELKRALSASRSASAGWSPHLYKPAEATITILVGEYEALKKKLDADTAEWLSEHTVIDWGTRGPPHPKHQEDAP